MDGYNLLDLEAKDTKFIWREPLIGGYSRIFKLLDKALCNIQWRDKFAEVIILNLPRLKFDHHSIIVDTREESSHKPTFFSFRFKAT